MDQADTKKRILIVEDDRFLLKALESKVRKLGYEVVTAKNGSEGLAVVLKEPPDLVLLDLLMPVMNGYDFMAEVKSEIDLSSMPIIILSNFGQAEEIKRGQDLGAVGYLVKADVSLEAVAEKIGEVLGGSRDPA